MTGATGRTARLCGAIIAAAAPLAPADVRRDWRREWTAEMSYAAGRARHLSAPRQVGADAALMLRCAGAFVHAAWLRWDRWRLEMLLQDVRYAIRTLVKKPGFAAITILTLAIGIGGNAAIFSAVRAVLLRPLPFPDPDRVVQLFSTTVRNPEAVAGTASPPDFIDWRRESTSFVEMAAINAGAYALTGDGPAEQVTGASVTGGFFTVLGVAPLYGRALTVEDDAVGGPGVAVLSHALWTRRFGADPQAVGRTITIDADAYRIVGIMPRGLAYPLQSEIWIPQRFTADEIATQRGAHYLDVVARLKDDASIDRAREEMRALAARLAEQYPSTNRNSRLAVHEMRSAMVGDVRTPLLLLLGAVGFVLLIVCVNVANLVLTRALGRTRELAIRTALGAGRVRLVRGVLIESLVLSINGGVAGLALALWATSAVSALDRSLGIPLLDETRIDGAVVTFTVGITVLAALLFGSLPAWHTSSIRDVAARIREESGNATGDRRRQRLRSLLIVAETALAVVLLVGAGLLLRSFVQLSSVDLGFDAPRVQTFNVSLPNTAYDMPPKRAALIDAIVTEAASLPGVEAAGAIFGLPLTDFGYTISMSTLDGRRLADDEQMTRSLQVRVVTPHYFRSMGIPILRGRAFEAADRLGAAPVVLVNETAANRLWPGEPATGHQFTLGTRMGQGGVNAGGMVIGVVKDVRDFGPAGPVRPTVYLAHAQFPVSFATITVRTSGAPEASVAALRGIVTRLDPNLPVFRVRTMDQIAGSAVAQPRVYLLLLSLFAAMAVLLAALGIYGVLMHAVAQRTREIGIRLALGAGRRDVVALVVRQAVALAVAGLVIGLAMALGATRLMAGLLFEVAPTDSTTYAIVAVGLMGVALLASYLPARRASRIDPVRAIKSD
jgi:putative ABC transport system permease protein